MNILEMAFCSQTSRGPFLMLPSRLLAEDKGMLTQLVPGSQVSHGLAAGWRLNVSLPLELLSAQLFIWSPHQRFTQPSLLPQTPVSLAGKQLNYTKKLLYKKGDEQVAHLKAGHSDDLLLNQAPSACTVTHSSSERRKKRRF